MVQIRYGLAVIPCILSLTFFIGTGDQAYMGGKSILA